GPELRVVERDEHRGHVLELERLDAQARPAPECRQERAGLTGRAAVRVASSAAGLVAPGAGARAARARVIRAAAARARVIAWIRAARGRRSAGRRLASTAALLPVAGLSPLACRFLASAISAAASTRHRQPQ